MPRATGSRIKSGMTDVYAPRNRIPHQVRDDRTLCPARLLQRIEHRGHGFGADRGHILVVDRLDTLEHAALFGGSDIVDLHALGLEACERLLVQAAVGRALDLLALNGRLTQNGLLLR